MSNDMREALAAALEALQLAWHKSGVVQGLPSVEAAILRVSAALATQPAQPSLHPATADLVRRFSHALAEKLAAAEAKYGYSDGWASPGWMDECRAKLMEHIAKGDPRDVAAYCAFLWHHGASTAQPSAQGEAVAWCPGDPLHDDAYVRGVAVGFAADDSRRTTLLRIADRIEALASAPAAPAQAVPLTDEHISALWMSGWGAYCSRTSFIAIFREAERAHGIKAASWPAPAQVKPQEC